MAREPMTVERVELREIDDDRGLGRRGDGLADGTGHPRIEIPDQANNEAIGRPFAAYGKRHRSWHPMRPNQLTRARKASLVRFGIGANAAFAIDTASFVVTVLLAWPAPFRP